MWWMPSFSNYCVKNKLFQDSSINIIFKEVKHLLIFVLPNNWQNKYFSCFYLQLHTHSRVCTPKESRDYKTSRKKKKVITLCFISVLGFVSSLLLHDMLSLIQVTL